MMPLFPVGSGDVADTSDDWYTQPWIFEAARLTFDMDVAAPVEPARRTCPARRYLTVLEDGLQAPWEGLVWMNPPWSGSRPWVEKFARHAGGGLALLPASKSHSSRIAIACADALALFTGQFFRPGGHTDHNPWLTLMIARGEEAISALQRIADIRSVPLLMPSRSVL